MTIMFIKNTPGTDRVRARLTEVLDLLVYVARAGREHGTVVITQHSDGVLSHELGVAAPIPLIPQLGGMLYNCQQLLVLVELFEVLSLDGLVASRMRALLRCGGQDISDAELAESVAAVGHNDRLALIKCILVAAAFAFEQILHLFFSLFNNKLI